MASEKCELCGHPKPEEDQKLAHAAWVETDAELSAVKAQAEVKRDKNLAELAKRRAAEHHVYRRRLHNQKVELRNLGKAYSGAWRLAHQRGDELKAREAEVAHAHRLMRDYVEASEAGLLEPGYALELFRKALRSAAKPARCTRFGCERPDAGDGFCDLHRPAEDAKPAQQEPTFIQNNGPINELTATTSPIPQGAQAWSNGDHERLASDTWTYKVDELISQAIEFPSLSDALSHVAVAETERAIRQAFRNARSGERSAGGRLWDTCANTHEPPAPAPAQASAEGCRLGSRGPCGVCRACYQALNPPETPASAPRDELPKRDVAYYLDEAAELLRESPLNEARTLDRLYNALRLLAARQEMGK